MNKMLLLDAGSYKSLQIFSNVDFVCPNRLTETLDANSFRTSFDDKFNNTLYSLYSTRIQTKMGIAKLRSFMMKPTRDLDVLNKRHQVIGFFCEVRNKEICDLMIKTLKKCKFISQILKRMRITRCRLNEWKRLYNTTQAFLKITQLAAIINERMLMKQDNKSAYRNNTFQPAVVSDLSKFQFRKNNTFLSSSSVQVAGFQADRIDGIVL
jgi:DNA mismatch repair ATPase MutS